MVWYSQTDNMNKQNKNKMFSIFKFPFLKGDLKKEDNPKIEDNQKNFTQEVDLNNENNPKNEDDLKIKMT